MVDKGPKPPAKLNCDTSGMCGVYVRASDGTISDAPIHEAIMARVNDDLLRRESARRAVKEFGLTIEQAEAVFKVQL